MVGNNCEHHSHCGRKAVEKGNDTDSQKRKQSLLFSLFLCSIRASLADLSNIPNFRKIEGSGMNYVLQHLKHQKKWCKCQLFEYLIKMLFTYLCFFPLIFLILFHGSFPIQTRPFGMEIRDGSTSSYNPSIRKFGTSPCAAFHY